jgi:hypothetical protein
MTEPFDNTKKMFEILLDKTNKLPKIVKMYISDNDFQLQSDKKIILGLNISSYVINDNCINTQAKYDECLNIDEAKENENLTNEKDKIRIFAIANKDIFYYTTGNITYINDNLLIQMISNKNRQADKFADILILNSIFDCIAQPRATPSFYRNSNALANFTSVLQQQTNLLGSIIAYSKIINRRMRSQHKLL